jgi:hypothetical protein
MPSEYTGDGSGIAARQNAVILCPIDSDAPNANSVNVPLQALANLLDFLMQNAGLLGVANNFVPIQTFSNGIHCGGSPVTGVVMPGSPASTNAVNKGYLDTVLSGTTLGVTFYAMKVNSSGTMVSSRGSIGSASVARGTAGVYQITDARLTSNSILIVTSNLGQGHIVFGGQSSNGWALIGSENLSGVATDAAFDVLVII